MVFAPWNPVAPPTGQWNAASRFSPHLKSPKLEIQLGPNQHAGEADSEHPEQATVAGFVSLGS
jgi:hypothetical protein